MSKHYIHTVTIMPIIP